MGKALLINPVDGAQLMLVDSVLIGSAPDCAVPLEDMTVAEHHASLNLVGEEWYLTALDGETKVDFRPVTPGETALLREGSSIQLGRFELFFTRDEAQIAAYESMGSEPPLPAADIPAPEPYYQPEPQPNYQPEPQPSYQPEPMPGPVNRQEPVSRQKKGKKGAGLIIALISAAAVLVLVLGWCLLFHLQGNSRMKQADYPAAISAYQKDFLFGRGGAREALTKAGEEAFAANDFEAAIGYFERLGKNGRERWADAVYAYGVQLTEQGRPEEAIEVLGQIAEEERAIRQTDVARLAVAQKLYDQGNYQEAVAAAKEVSNPDNADPTPLLNAAYLRIAGGLLRSGRDEEAMTALDSCVDDAKAESNAEALRALLHGDLAAGARAATLALNYGNSELTREEWLTVLERHISSNLPSELKARLDREAALAILGEPVQFGGSDYESRVEEMTDSQMVGAYEGYDDEWHAFSSLDELYSQCGANPAGKILIVASRHSYPDRNETFAVRFDLMRLLPAERYPASLDEVEYVMVITYDFSKDGSYTNGITVGVRENARINAYRMPDKGHVQAGSSVSGPHSPDTILVLTPPAYYSGGVPSITEEFVRILGKLLEK